MPNQFLENIAEFIFFAFSIQKKTSLLPFCPNQKNDFPLKIIESMPKY